MPLQFFLFGKLKGVEGEGNSMGMCYEKPTPELDSGVEGGRLEVPRGLSPLHTLGV